MSIIHVSKFLEFLCAAADYDGGRIYYDSKKTIWSGPNHRGYVWSGQGQLYTQALAESWHAQAKAGKKSVPSSRDKNSYYIGDCSKWVGRVIDDCGGLIVDAIRSVKPSFGDKGSGTLISQCAKTGAMASMPEVPGLILWREGHVGVYIGGGMQIEARGTDYGVVVSPVGSQKWTKWGYSNHVIYDASEPDKSTLRAGDKGPEVTRLQELLIAWDVSCLPKFSADGGFGAETEKAVKAFQWAHGLDMDGVVGALMWELLEAEEPPREVEPPKVEEGPEVSRPFRGLVKGTSVNVRKGRGATYEKVCVAYNKPEEADELLLSNLKDGWYEVTFMPKSNGFSPVNGFISAEYIRAI